jgi:hypothetical protein
MNNNFKCLQCFHCKTKIFKTTKDLQAWCGRKSIICNRSWLDYIVFYGSIRLLWCDVQTDQYCPRGFAPRNANPKYSMKDSAMDNQSGIEITTSLKKSFIPNCPYMET